MRKYQKDLVIKNVNPNLEHTGDCVLRSFTSYFNNELTYNEIEEKIAAFAKKEGNNERHPYRRPCYFNKFANEANMVAIFVDEKKEFSTGNRLIKFCKNNKINAIGISNTHAAYFDYKLGLIDTWDSRRKHIEYILVNKDDAQFIGAKPKKDNRSVGVYKSIEVYEF